MITFNLSSSEFYNKVSNIAKVISNKNSLPVLDDILFQVSDNEIKMTAADSESQVTTSLPTIADGTAVFGVDAHLLLNSLKELPEQPLTVEVDLDLLKCRIKYMNGTFDMPVRKDEEFPMKPVIKQDNVCYINADTFHRIVNKTIGYVEIDEIRPVLGGVSFNFGEKLEICATGGCQLIKITTTYTGESSGSFILGYKACKLTDMFVGKQTGDVKIKFDNMNVSFELEGYSYVCRLIDGRYPNYNSVIPKNYQDNVIVGRAELTSALKRVMVFTNSQSCLVRFNINDSVIKVTGMDVDFSRSAEESLNCTCNGKNIIAGLKGSFVINILNSLGVDNIKISYFSNGAAFLFEPETSNSDFDILCLLMPMMLND